MNEEYIEIANSVYRRVSNRLGADVGNLELLVTEVKSSLVDAINEVAITGGSNIGGDVNYVVIINTEYNS